MNYVPQPQEDMLDAVFQNRNKAYGAYALRRGYDQTVTRSFLYCFALMAAAAIWLNLRNTEQPAAEHVIKGREIIFTEMPIIIGEPEVPKTQPEPQPEPEHNVGGPSQPVPGGMVKVSGGTSNFSGYDSSNLSSGNMLSGGATSTPGISSSGGGSGYSSDSSAASSSPDPYAPVNYTADMPEFPGGVVAMQRFIRENLQYPIAAKRAGKGGKVVLRFVVNPNGEIDRIQSLNTEQGYGMEEEARRVLNMMPKWKPGTQNGHPVAVYYVLPVRFELE